MIATYYWILWDVLIGLAFLVGFKVVGGYLMKMMYGWFSDDVSATKPKQTSPMTSAETSAAASSWTPSTRFLWTGLTLAWILSAALQIRPTLVTTDVQHILLVTAGTGSSADVPGIAQALATWWATHAIDANIFAILIQLVIGLMLWLGRKHWLGKATVWVSAILSLSLWIVAQAPGGLIDAKGTLLSGPSQAGLWVFVLSAVLLFPTRVWSAKRTDATVRIVRSVLFIGLGAWELVSPADASVSFLHLGPSQAAAFHLAWAVLLLIVGGLEWVRPLDHLLDGLLLLALFAAWSLSEGFGWPGGYALAIGSAPVLAVLSLGTRHLSRAARE
ncbi:MAG: hypothetical protein OWU32_01785 [Firmicutes bacterium]|nr:hypothetical protein [Bacillota bacterium]